MQQINLGMDPERSRLTSITEEEIEQEAEPKTQQALLKVYHQLYAAEYNAIPYSNPRNVFVKISDRVNRQNPTPLIDFEPLDEEQAMVRAEGQLTNLLKRQQKQMSVKNFLSKGELAAKLNQTKKKPIEIVQLTPILKEQQTQIEKDIEDTAITRASVPELLSQLKDLDSERNDIKYQIFTEEPRALHEVYGRWGDLHTKMKQTLEQYIEVIGRGSSLSQIFKRAEKAKGKTIDGVKAQAVYSKLQTFLQSLYLDERELMMYREECEKALSIKSCPSKARKRLIFS